MFLFASASTDVDVLVIMVTNEVQAEDVLYGHLGAVEGIHLCYPSFKLIFISFSLTIFQLFHLEQLLYLLQQSLPHLLVSLKGV